MSVTDDTNKLSVTAESVEQAQLLFAQLEPQHVEAFYQHYQYWQQQQHAIVLQEQIAAVEQHIVNNTLLMQNAQPSPIALATLTRLQSNGVEDVDLLDVMLERGDTWLDHTLQQLEQCEKLDLIHDNYTEWCRLALDGAYDWLDSMNETQGAAEQQPHEAAQQEEVRNDATESLLLEKLMSEDETAKIPAVLPTLAIPTLLSYRIQQKMSEGPLAQSDEQPVIAIPSLLSYVINSNAPVTLPEEVAQQTKEQSSSILTAADRQQKPLKLGLVSRIMAKVWQT